MSATETAKKAKKAKTVKLVDDAQPVKMEVDATPLVAEGAVKKEKKEKKEKKLPSPKELPVEAVADAAAPPALEEVSAAEPAVEESAEGKLSRRRRTYAQLLSELDQLQLTVTSSMEEGKLSKVNDLNRFLKSVEKGLRRIRVHVQKIGKNRAASSTSSNVQSGFQKPVQISEAVASFTGWNVAEPRARVEVTNFVCDYIKQNNLQSPDDRRVILADEKLSHLLDYDRARDGNLTYATIQKLLAKHYTAMHA
jgi:chromatin remodeling complex protein RSC6